MKVSDVMNRRVQTVLETDDVRVAMHAMLDGGFSGVPVIDRAGSLVGILTEGDFIRRAETGTARTRSFWQEFLLGTDRLAHEYADTHGRIVREIMTREVCAVDASALLQMAVALMEQHNFRRLPVVENGHLVGVLSRSDLVRACLHIMEHERYGSTVGDALIRARIIQLVASQPWGPKETVRIDVAHGQVDLEGVITSEAVRDALRILAENVPGVTSVRDDLTTIEPMSGCIVRSPS